MIWDWRDRGFGMDSRAEKMSELAEQIDSLCDDWLRQATGKKQMSRETADAMRLADIVKDAGVEGITRNQLTRKTQDMTAQARQKAIDVLLCGNMTAETTKSGARTKTTYRSNFLE
jgi:hypothetical protein